MLRAKIYMYKSEHHLCIELMANMLGKYFNLLIRI